MNKAAQDLYLCCEHLTQRLPELMWKLPVWPKNFLKLIPVGLFQIQHQWTPQQAIAEIQKHIQQLRLLPADSAKANFLSQKIFKQIETLVMVSKKLPQDFQVPIEKNALTRMDYVSSLQEQIHALDLQIHALENSMQLSNYPEKVQEEIHKAKAYLFKLQQLLVKA
ncbi:MAG TPA: hypothetical protein DCZ80_03205 [Legionellales bacterium]|nr:hypothetical protein [Legionellales bacterium]